MFDIAIIGAGVIGCSIARELSRYKLNICVIEKCQDICEGTTKANSAIVHAGFDAEPNTMKGKLNAKGNSMFDKLSKELDFPFKRNGSMVVCFDREDINIFEKLVEHGKQNNVPGVEIINGDRARELEPNLSKNIKMALIAPSGGIVCPYEMTIALAENAFLNGVNFKLETKVCGIEKNKDGFVIKTNKNEIHSRIVINAAGVFADEINNMISKNKISIKARKGEYCLFDKAVGDMVKMTIFQTPSKLGKGILVTPTVDGNLLVGPNSQNIDDKEDLTTTYDGLSEVLEKGKTVLNYMPEKYIITSFAGLRAKSSKEDFILRQAKDVPGFINAAGIESPGLSSAPAIAELICNDVIKILKPIRNESFNPIRKSIPKFREMTNEERYEIIKKNPAYGRVICRCEKVTEGEIIEAIRRPLGAKTLDGIKRRTRAGMGRCQSGFCMPKIAEILSRECNIPIEDVTKFGFESKIIEGKTRNI